MPLETITYISDLNPANPTVSDGLVQGDDHLRGIKAALKNTLPNFTGAALSSTQAQLDALVGAVTISTGQVRAHGGYAGQIVDFPKVPTRFTNGAVAAGGQAAIDWIECDGSVYNMVDYPDVGAFLGNTFGGNGTTTFGVPNTKDTGRYRRSRTSTVTEGTAQANQIGAHTHTGTTASGGVDHTHAFSGTTGGQSADHSHNVNVPTPATLGRSNGSGSPVDVWGGGGNAITTSGGASNDHTHSFSGNTGASTAYLHTHTFTTNSTGGTETRPESLVVVTCIKT